LTHVHDTVTQASAYALALPLRVEETMLGAAGYTMAVIDGVDTEAPMTGGAKLASDASASVVSVLPISWQASVARVFDNASHVAHAFFGAGVRAIAGLFPGGATVVPTLTIVPTQTALSMPSIADSLTNTPSSTAGGTTIQNIVNNYYPQTVVSTPGGAAFNDAVLAVVAPFVYKNNDSIVKHVRSSGGGGSSGPVSESDTRTGMTINDSTFNNVNITSGTAQLSNLTATLADIVSFTTANLTAQIASLGTTTVADLAVGTISSSLIPNGNLIYNLGSPSNYWSDAYIDELHVNNFSVGSTTIDGTASDAFTINSDNASADAEDSSLALLAAVSTPSLNTPQFSLGSSTFTSLLGYGLQNVSGALSIATSSFSGTSSNFNADLLDGQDGSYYLNRANHTGTQLASTISDFSNAARTLFSNTATGLSFHFKLELVL
uniref:Phage tail protein n=1 Tax=Globodera pallida TaxID=36090 RepID=A0A183CRM1_GLOPA